MKYLAFATDFDGTIARTGVVEVSTFAALQRLKNSGRKLILATGRDLGELRQVCPRLALFDRVVVENGALIYRPSDHSVILLAGPPPASFLEALRKRAVSPMSVGRVIVATWRPDETIVAEVIQSLGLDLQIILNKRAVMVLPAGVDKATGLKAALKDLGIPAERTLAVGDGENDLTMLDACGFSAVVANAVEDLKQKVDMVLTQDHGAGVAELITWLLKDEPSANPSPPAPE